MWRFAVGGESRRFGARCSGPGNASDQRGSSLFIARTDNMIWEVEGKNVKNKEFHSIAKDRDLASFYVILRRTQKE